MEFWHIINITLIIYGIQCTNLNHNICKRDIVLINRSVQFQFSVFYDRFVRRVGVLVILDLVKIRSASVTGLLYNYLLWKYDSFGSFIILLCTRLRVSMCKLASLTPVSSLSVYMLHVFMSKITLSRWIVLSYNVLLHTVSDIWYMIFRFSTRSVYSNIRNNCPLNLPSRLE